MNCLNLTWDLKLGRAVKVNERGREAISLNSIMEPFRL